MHIEAGPKKALWFGAVALLLVALVLAAGAELTGGFDPLWRHLQASALALGASCLLLLVALAVLARGGETALGCMGLVAAPVAAALNLYAIWTDAAAISTAGRLMATATFVALAIAAVSLMALARLQTGWQTRLRRVATAVVSAAMGYICVLVWLERSAWGRQALAVMLILAALAVAAVWIMHFFNNKKGGEKTDRSSPSLS